MMIDLTMCRATESKGEGAATRRGIANTLIATMHDSQENFLSVEPLAKLPLRNDQLQKQSPQGLKPLSFQSTYGTTKVVP
jgi:hypothetical protein